MTSTSTKKLILCVEDHSVTRLMLTMVFEQSGYDTVTSATLSDALDLATGQSFDLYLFDIDLPDGSGLDLARRIRAFDTHTPLVFLSAYASSEQIDAGLKAGAQAYITKPMCVDNLLETVDGLIQTDDVGTLVSKLRVTHLFH
jgi:CheY-like chemotaxis protein